jgi:hypothetical protein
MKTTFILASALLAIPILGTPTYAQCRGIGCTFARGIPIIGPAALAADGVRLRCRHTASSGPLERFKSFWRMDGKPFVIWRHPIVSNTVI